MADNFESCPALSFDAGLGDRLNVSVMLVDGAPSSVSFSDPDRDALVSVPFDLWARTVAAVERAFDLNRTDGGAS